MNCNSLFSVIFIGSTSSAKEKTKEQRGHKIEVTGRHGTGGVRNVGKVRKGLFHLLLVLVLPSSKWRASPPLSQVSDPNCSQRGRLSLMCWVPLSTKQAGSCLNWYKKGQARDELVSGHKNQSVNCINLNWEWYFDSLWTMFVWWNFITRALNLQ